MTLVSGFLHTDVINFVDCPVCRRPTRMRCVTNKGKKLGTPHRSRIDAYLNKFPDRLELYKDGPDRLDRALLYNQRMLQRIWN